jgi:hypothetical protein
MYFKLHKAENKTVFACCDKELIGKEILHGGITLKIDSSFYGKEKISEKKFLELINEADSANLLGEKAVKLALKNRLVSEKDVIRIKNIPHIQIFKV